jgi:Zn-finger nucleic acid-binding protein
MNCPKCNSSMEVVAFQGIEVDRCTSCKGIWFESCKRCGGAYFDAGEFKDLKEETLSDFIKDLFAKERE